MPDLPACPTHASGLTCVHAARGLCPACRADYREDPGAWVEFGAHQAGIERWYDLEAEMAYEGQRFTLAQTPDDVPESEIPF